MKNLLIKTLTLSAAFTFSTVSLAADEAAPAARPSTTVGGHVGLAVPLVTFADPITGIGADYTLIGLAPGVTVKLDEHWSIDFEMVAYSDFWGSTTDGTGSLSSLVVDPGVIYNWGFMATGLRTAVHVGKTQNWGFIPIINKGFPIGNSGLAAFVELDFPIFFNEAGASLTIQPQAGIAF